jgi:predicted component of type VI protein secretion system
MSESLPQELVRARASINLPGLPLGVVATVDRAVPYVADAIEHGYLVPEETVRGADQPSIS